MNRQKIKLFCNPWGHYATLYVDEVKEIKQNGSYWFIEMKDGKDCKRSNSIRRIMNSLYYHSYTYLKSLMILFSFYL